MSNCKIKAVKSSNKSQVYTVLGECSKAMMSACKGRPRAGFPRGLRSEECGGIK